MKKFISTITALAVTLGTLVVPQVSAKAETVNTATAVEDAKVLTVDSIDEIAENAAISCEASLDDSTSVFKAYIPQDSIVQVDYSGTADGGDYWNIGLYANEALTAEIFTDHEYAISGTYSGDTKICHLKKGNYYILLNSEHNVDARVSVSAVPTSKVFGLTAKKKTLTLTNNFPGKRTTFLFDGKIKFGDNYPSDDEFKYESKTVNKSGWYTAVFLLYGNSSNLHLSTLGPETYDSVFISTLVDVDKPVVKGVKNGGLYKKATLRFSDKHSGIKSATLNGKSVKSGVKVTKAGSYKLIVTDNYGNKTTVKFKIKK